MSRLPEGYEERRNEDITYVFRAGDHAVIKEMGLANLFTIEDMLASGPRRGRGRIFEVPPPEEMPGEALVLKQVFHGGLYGRLNRDRFIGPGRVLDEVALVQEARDRGVSTPEVAFAAWSHDRPCRLFLATVRVPASRSVAEILQGIGLGSDRRRALRSAARAVREMHDAGLVHGDLNLRNLMVAETESYPEGFVIDLDRSWFPTEVKENHRAANLARLLRSLEKSQPLARKTGVRERLRFLRDYCGGMGPLYRRLRRRVGRRSQGFALHRLAWRLGWR